MVKRSDGYSHDASITITLIILRLIIRSCPKGLTGDNLLISKGMPEITSFNDSDFLTAGAKIWILYHPSALKPN